MDMVVQSPPPHPLTPQLRTAAVEAGTVLLGKYQMGRLLGRGSFAKVHHARSVETDAAVAIKVINKKKTVAAGMESKILSEVAAMRRLHDHPNILKIHEVMATKSNIYLVMEYAAGGDLLSKLIRHGGKFPEPVARRYFQQLASALRFCHQNGFAHRDIKPQNLLLDKVGNLKVSDFGLSALPEQIKNGLLHTACGTPAYVAPEVVARKGYDGAKADAWSCGVILFVLLAGFLPFDDSNLMMMYRKIQRRDYKFPNGISKPTRSIIYKLLDPNPGTRFSVEAVMETRWFKNFMDKPKSDEKNYNSLDSSDDLPQKVAKLESESINAFDLISLSSGLDLSGLFEVRKKKGKRFTARVSAGEVVVRAGEVGGRLGYGVERRKVDGGSVVRLRKKAAVVAVELVGMPVEAAAVVVEVKMLAGEVGEDRWEELIRGFDEFVLSWHSDM